MVLRPEGTGGFSLKGKGRDGFSWQSRYGAFPVSQSARVPVFYTSPSRKSIIAERISHYFISLIKIMNNIVNAMVPVSTHYSNVKLVVVALRECLHALYLLNLRQHLLLTLTTDTDNFLWNERK
jgi:hypothetical protein